MAYPDDRKYTKDHEWIRLSGDTADIGITDYAQQQLGDVVYVDLPESGAAVSAGQAFGSIESVKAVSELFAPMSGTIVDVNGDLRNKPEVVNSDPHGTWMIRIKVANAADAGSLLDSAQYQALLG
jgi:glycine cleavage system H protein